MVTIIVFILIIYLFVRNNELKTENQKLKNQLAKQETRKIENSEIELDLKEEDSNIDKTSIIETVVEESPQKEEVYTEKIVKPKVKAKKYNDQEIKNTTILSVGAILVILSAIIFLTTTWNTSLNIIKTFVILLMFLVFLGSSYIADKYLKIKQTSTIFLYIAFSYLPLVFISISIFELLGHYLSFYGPGKYIYLAISTIILAIIYYYYMISKKDIFFAIGSIIFQVLSVILLVLIFTTNINVVLLGISIYALVYNILYAKNKYYYNEETHLGVLQTTVVPVLVISIFSSFLLKKLVSLDIYYILLLVSLYFNICSLLKNNSKAKEYLSIASSIMIVYIFTNIAYLINEGFIIYQLMILISIVINYLIELILSKKLSTENFVINSVVLMSIYLITFTQNNVIPSYLMLLLQILITIYAKVLNDNNDLDYIISIAVNIEILNIFYSLNINYLLLPIMYLIVFVASNLLKEKQLKLTFKETSVIFTIIGYIISIYNNSTEYTSLMIIAAIITLVYFIYYLTNKSKIIKYLSYCWLIVTCYYTTINIVPNSDYLLYAISISSFITFMLDKFLSPKEENWYELILGELIVTFFCLTFTTSSLVILLFPVITILFIIYNKDWNKTDYLNIIPIISFFLYIINYNDSQNTTIMTISIIITSVYFIYYLTDKNKIIKYISYCWLIVTCYYTAINIVPNSDYSLYAISMSSIITYMFDKYLSPKEENWYEFILGELIVTFFCLSFTNSNLALLLFPIMTMIFILYNKEWNKTDYLNIIPILSIYSYIISKNINEMNYYTVICYLIPIVLLIYLYSSKKKEYIILSLVSTILAILAFPQNTYIVIISLLLCLITYYAVDDNNRKGYLSGIYILLTILAKKIIYDLNLTNITVLNIGIYIAPLLLMTRTIMSKDNNDYKTIEYVGLIIIYFIALTNYSSESDGMLFVFLLLVLTIVSYYKKYGPVFLTSLISILVNVFILTRVFWLSIPWWVYILFVGSTLIAFAIRNEISEKNKKESILKEVAKKIDL